MASNGGGDSELTSSGGELRTVFELAAAVAAFVGAVYLIGWIVSWARFTAARLPADVTAAALGQQLVLGAGLRSVALTAVAFAVACAVAWFSARRRWDVHGQDWHDLVRLGGVANARSDPETRKAHAAREALVSQESSKARAARLRKVAAAANRLGAAPIARRAAGNAAAHDALADVHLEPPAQEPAPLGEWAVRLVAGFNIAVLSALLALIPARLAEELFPWAWWGIAIVWAVGWWLARLALTQWGPLTWGPRLHGAMWAIVAIGALFASAPVGVLLLTSVAIATVGRKLARLPKPSGPAQFIRSPLPWALLMILALVALADSAIPPVGFPRVVITTAAGQTTGGYVARTGAGVYVVTCTALADATSTDEQLKFVPERDIHAIAIGGPQARLDSGQRPSLAALAFRALGVSGHPPTPFTANLRARQGTCAGADPSPLSLGSEDPALGAGVIAGPATAASHADDGEKPIEQRTRGIASLARRYQPTLLVTVADLNWPVSVGALLADRGVGGKVTCLMEHRSAKPVCPATADSLGGTGSKSSDYLQYPVRLAGYPGRDPLGLPVDPSPTGQFEPFERGQYALESDKYITTGRLHSWLTDPGRLNPWYTAQIYFYNLGMINSFQQWPVKDPNVPTGLIGFEYWFFYPYNYYPLVSGAELMNDAPLAADHVNVDFHQGDWEHVDVLLDPATMTPQWLYLARHSDEGQWYEWSSPALSFDQTHPIVQAAFGGHPSYLPGCGARPRTKTSNLSGDWLVCGSGRFAFRGATTPLVDIATQPWRCWPGSFGENVQGVEASPSTNESLMVKARKFVYVGGPQAPLRQAENRGTCK